MTPALTQLKELAQMGMTQMASKQELEVFLKAIIQIVKELQTKNGDNATSLLARFQNIKTELDKKGADIEKANNEAQKLLKMVKEMIPAVPDITPLESRLFEVENTQLFITCGVGETDTRARLFNHPQISLLEIKF